MTDKSSHDAGTKPYRVESSHGGLRRGAGRGAVQIEQLERRQPAAVERSGDGGAAGVGDLGAEEVELGSDLYF
jgi:hypothetical protein